MCKRNGFSSNSLLKWIISCQKWKCLKLFFNTKMDSMNWLVLIVNNGPLWQGALHDSWLLFYIFVNCKYNEMFEEKLSTCLA